MLATAFLIAFLTQDPVEPLLKSLKQGWFECDSARARTIAAFGPKKELVAALKTAIEKTGMSVDEFEMRDNCLHALGHLNTEEAVAELFEETRCAVDIHCARAWRYLGHVDKPETRTALLGYLEAVDSERRSPSLGDVILALCDLREKKAIPSLLKIAGWGHHEESPKAAAALGVLGDAETAAELVRRLKNPRWQGVPFEDLRAAMSSSAARLGRKELEADLEKMLGSNLSMVPYIASDYFLSIGSLKGAAFHVKVLREFKDRHEAATSYKELRRYFPDMPACALSKGDFGSELSVAEGKKAGDWIDANRTKFTFDPKQAKFTVK